MREGRVTVLMICNNLLYRKRYILWKMGVEDEDKDMYRFVSVGTKY